MTTLVFQTLTDELSQEVFYHLERRMNIASFSPYLLMMNAPTGTFTFEVTGTNGVVVSEEFTSADIKAELDTVNDFAHIFYAIVPTSPVFLERGSYTIRISATGYSPSSTSFIGWIQQHENIQNVMTYTPLRDDQNSFAVRYKEYQEGIL